MADLHYDHPRLAALYDLESGWSEDRDFYLNLAGRAPINILDIGCGTGLICNAYAKLGHKVTGLDPSAAMLTVAKNSTFGSQINWVEAFSQDFKLTQKFDIIIMTGHAFQVLLTDEDVSNTFKQVKNHLATNGKFVFETRNPNIDWAKQWSQSSTINLPNQAVEISRHFIGQDGEHINFDHHYKFDDQTLVSNSRLRFMSHKKIAQQIELSGLNIFSLFGDWQRGAFQHTHSKEMIFTLNAKLA